MQSPVPSIDQSLKSLPPPGPQRDREIPLAVKGYLAEVREYLRGRHRAGESGRAVNEANSDLTDRMVRRLFMLAEESILEGGGDLDPGLCVVAVGGYARREMSIFSDVDLLILYRDALSPYVSAVAERLQYWLWDAGLSVGCATRTLEDTVSLGREDVTVRTAVLTARYLCGDGEFFHDFADSIRQQLLPDPLAFVLEQRELLAERHIEYGESLFLLQPNVKEGAGALRDYHTAYWVARGAQPSVRNVDDFLHFGLLTEPEMDEYRAALDFLWRVRNELHLQTTRATDQMSFELQEIVAEALGYGSTQEYIETRGQIELPPPTLTPLELRQLEGRSDLPVERFMRDYYRQARAIETYSELVIEQCTSRVAPGSQRHETPVEQGFRLADGQLEIPHAAQLREDPLRLLHAYRVAQLHQAPLSRMAQRMIREHVPLVTEELRAKEEFQSLFQEILDSEHRVTRTLMNMNDVGLLAAVMPEWEHIVCRWQHVIYHTYTVDVHSIFLVEELRRLWRGKYQHAMPELTELMREVADRPVLFLGCLLHDIGKGFGGDHSNKGVLRAEPCVRRLGLSPERAERVIFLVRHHLLMSHLAQNRDLSDPKLILELAQICGDRINLRNLYLVTFADVRASSKDAWTDWKGQLLRELYERSAELLETGADDKAKAMEVIEARVEKRMASARLELSELGVGETKIDGYFDSMPRRYFVSHTPAQIVRHAQVMLRYGRDKTMTTSVREMRGFSEFIICTDDVHGLFAKVAGSLAANGLNILGTHVYTTKSNLAIEIYRVRTPAGGIEERKLAWAELEETLEQVLSGSVPVEDLVRRRRRPVGAARLPGRRAAQVLISNDVSEFYTVVDVIADDRIGLLYDVTRAIDEQGLEIYISKAATIKDQVSDAFYLKDEQGRKIKDPDRLEHLRSALLVAAKGPVDRRG